MELCPLEPAWGTVGEWATVAVGLLAAIATFGAVLVAVKTSRQSMELARKLRDEDQAARKESERLRAVARSLVFDLELFMLGGQLQEIINELTPDRVEAQPMDALRWMAKAFPVNPLPMLSRFAGELDAFGPADSSLLLVALGQWNNLSEPMRFADFSDAPAEVVVDGITAHRRGLNMYLAQLRAARDVAQRWSREVRDDTPPTDWSLKKPHAAAST